MTVFSFKDYPLDSINKETHPHLKDVNNIQIVEEEIVFDPDLNLPSIFHELYMVLKSDLDKCTHIRIRRLDKQPIHNWEHIQKIKNHILGEETIAIEVYPKQSQLINGSNTYHLFTWSGIAVPDLKSLYTYID